MAAKLLRRTFRACLTKQFQRYHRNFASTTHLHADDGYRQLVEEQKTLALKAKIGDVVTTPAQDLSKKNVSFHDLFRRSKFCQLGEESESIVIGKVIDVVSNDLYIDFGGKFHCVCSRPVLTEIVKDESGNATTETRFDESYTYGTKVKLQLKELEMASRFLGSARHTSLLEADAVLLGKVTQKEILQEEMQENILY